MRGGGFVGEGGGGLPGVHGSMLLLQGKWPSGDRSEGGTRRFWGLGYGHTTRWMLGSSGGHRLPPVGSGNGSTRWSNGPRAQPPVVCHVVPLLALPAHEHHMAVSILQPHSMVPMRVPSGVLGQRKCARLLTPIPPPCAQDIKLFINSPGGSVTAGMGIYDAMQVRSHLQGRVMRVGPG